MPRRVDRKPLDLGHIDLNLLEPLQALLEERSVTRAADRLGRSQPAVSASLARLRTVFSDELLSRVGNRYELTPLAEQLKPRCAAALASLGRVFGRDDAFDPSASYRAFRLAVSDYGSALVGRHASAILARAAPAASLRFQPMAAAIIEHAPEALRPLDGAILPLGFITDVPHVQLFEDRWVCLSWADHDIVGNELSMGHLAAMPWVVSYGTQTSFTPAVRQLQLLGIDPHVQVVVDGFLSIPSFLVGTDRVALIQERLIPCLPHPEQLRVWPCPFDAVPISESLWWHPMYDDDPEHRWLRHVLVDAGRRVTAGTVAAAGAGGAS